MASPLAAHRTRRGRRGEDGDQEDEPEDDAGEEEEEDKEKKAANQPDKKKPEETVSRAELNKAVKARQLAKTQLREVKAELAKLKQENETSAEKAAREAREADAATEKRYKPIAIRAVLLEAGVRPAKVEGAVRLLEMDDIEVDGGSIEVTGLDEQLDSLKQDWPELFVSAESEGGGERERRWLGS